MMRHLLSHLLNFETAFHLVEVQRCSTWCRWCAVGRPIGTGVPWRACDCVPWRLVEDPGAPEELSTSQSLKHVMMRVIQFRSAIFYFVVGSKDSAHPVRSSVVVLCLTPMTMVR
jgi:hypothetical protein